MFLNMENLLGFFFRSSKILIAIPFSFSLKPTCSFLSMWATQSASFDAGVYFPPPWLLLKIVSLIRAHLLKPELFASDKRCSRKAEDARFSFGVILYADKLAEILS